MIPAKKTALLITKSSPLREFVQQISGPCGLNVVVHAASLTEALSSSRTLEPSIALLDWELGEASKHTLFLQRWRKLPGKKSVPLVLICKDASQSILAIAGEYGVLKIVTLCKLEESLKADIIAVLAEFKSLSPIQNHLLKLDRALERHAQAEIDKAIEDLYAAFPQHPRAQIEFGNLCLRKGNFDEARSIGEKLQHASPINLRASNLLARCLLHQGHTNAALEMLDKAEILSPKNLERLLILANACRERENFTEAKGHYEGALEVDEENNEAKKGLGGILLYEGDINQALELLRDSTSEDELAGLFNNVAVLTIRKGEFEQGVHLYKCAQGALKTERLIPKILFNLGLAYKKWNKQSEAVQCLEEALRMDPSYEKARKHLFELQGAPHSEIMPPKTSTLPAPATHADAPPTPATLESAATDNTPLAKKKTPGRIILTENIAAQSQKNQATPKPAPQRTAKPAKEPPPKPAESETSSDEKPDKFFYDDEDL